MHPTIAVLTGAGISAESGLKTFRGQDGLWENHPIEDVASIEGFHRNPRLVQEFYNMRRKQLLLPEIKPNEAHLALAELEAKWPGKFLLITQNVDDLHERGGSRELIHMHGELLKARCQKTQRILKWTQDIEPHTPCPGCQETQCLRPHIVWFGEMPLEMERIYQYLEQCDVFISIGTSGQVYPAAGFVRATRPGTRTLELNLEGTHLSPHFQEQVVGPATETVPSLVRELLNKI